MLDKSNCLLLGVCCALVVYEMSNILVLKMLNYSINIQVYREEKQNKTPNTLWHYVIPDKQGTEIALCTLM